VEEGFHLWSDSYDRKLDNIFEVQDEIAAAIVAALKLQLDVGERPTASTNNVEAFDLYLRGRQYGRDPSKEGLLRAIDFYNQAIAHDPNFARAYSGIADAYVWLEDFGGFRADEVFPRAEEAARKALELDPQLAEAQVSMGNLTERYHRDSLTAQNYYERALELNPNYSMTYALYPGSLADLGDNQRRLALFRKAVEIDPMSSFARSRMASVAASLEGRDAGMKVLDEMLAKDPNDTHAIEEKAGLLQQKGHFAQAIALFRRLHVLRPGDPFAAANIATMAVQMSDPELARKWIAEARGYGADNRWEHFATTYLYRSTGDWVSLNSLMATGSSNVPSDQHGWPDLYLGDWQAAREKFEAVLVDQSYQPNRLTAKVVLPLMGLFYLDSRKGITPDATRLVPLLEFLDLLESEHLFNQRGARPNLMRSWLAALKGDRVETLARLTKAIEQGFDEYWFLNESPFFSDYKDDPEFKAVAEGLRQHGLEEREKLRTMDSL
jgi:tetratricopeptide (TPR) repeat protein